MTYAPANLRKLNAYWKAQGGLSGGIVGDTAHAAKGTSYHLGKSQLRADAYSRQTPRDRAGLSEAASAIDLSHARKRVLRDFSVWLVEQARANGPGTRDLREIIYSPDGVKVLRWDRERGYASAPREGEADDTHRWHTHISTYRDAHDNLVPIFRPYFITPPDTGTPGGPDVDLTTLTIYSTPRKVRVPKGTPLYLTLDYSDDPVIISPARDMPVAGQFKDTGPYLIGYTPDSGAVPAELEWRILRNRDVGALDMACAPVAADCTAAVAAAVAPLAAQIAELELDLQAATDDERDRIADAEAERIRGI